MNIKKIIAETDLPKNTSSVTSIILCQMKSTNSIFGNGFQDNGLLNLMADPSIVKIWFDMLSIFKNRTTIFEKSLPTGKENFQNFEFYGYGTTDRTGGDKNMQLCQNEFNSSKTYHQESRITIARDYFLKKMFL